MDIPQKIRETYDRIKKEYPSFVALKVINRRYYLYSQTTKADKKKGKLKTISHYLGRITEEGVFIKKGGTTEDKLEIAKAIIFAHGGKVILPEGNREEKGQPLPISELTPDEKDQKIITALSMNARASFVFIGRQIGSSPNAAYNKVKQIERQYKIKYISEISAEKLGYHKFFVMVRFIGTLPPIQIIKKIVEAEPKVHFAILV